MIVGVFRFLLGIRRRQRAGTTPPGSCVVCWSCLVCVKGAVGEAGASSDASVPLSPLSSPWRHGASHGPLRPDNWLVWPLSECRWMLCGPVI